jgi:hypothetical protein
MGARLPVETLVVEEVDDDDTDAVVVVVTVLVGGVVGSVVEEPQPERINKDKAVLALELMFSWCGARRHCKPWSGARARLPSP